MLFQLVVVLICLPDNGLLVVESLLSLLSSRLLLHLASQQLAHLFLFEAITLHTALVFKSCSHLLFILETHEHLLLVLDAALLLGDHITGQSVHEVLGAGLASTELPQSI